jgi:hypothetical protein
LLPVEAVIRRKDLEGFANHDRLPRLLAAKSPPYARRPA